MLIRSIIVIYELSNLAKKKNRGSNFLVPIYVVDDLRTLSINMNISIILVVSID